MESFIYSVIVDIVIALTSPFACVGPFFCHGAAGRCGNIFFVLFLEQFEKIWDERFFEEVTFEPAVNEEVHKTVRAKDGQMLRYVRLTNIKGLLEIAHAFDAFGEFFKNLDADGVGDDFENINPLFCRNHIGEFSFRCETQGS